MGPGDRVAVVKGVGSGPVNGLTQQWGWRGMLSDRRILSLGATSMGQLGRMQKSQAASEKKLKAYACELEQKLEARTRELAEAQERQAAADEVLRVISSSPGDLEPVFETILADATRLCQAKLGMLYLWEGEGQYRVAALHGAPPRLAEERRPGTVVRPAPNSGLGRIAQMKRTVHIADVRAIDVPPGFTPSGIAIYGGARTA